MTSNRSFDYIIADNTCNRVLRFDLQGMLEDMEEERIKIEKERAREEKRARLMAMPRRMSGKRQFV